MLTLWDQRFESSFLQRRIRKLSVPACSGRHRSSFSLRLAFGDRRWQGGRQVAINAVGTVESPIEGRYGFAAVTSDSADLAGAADGLGQRWEVLNNAYKPYPCGVVLFPVIDACLELRARLALKMEAIDRVVGRGHPLMRERTDRPNVETGRDARVSLQHTVAAVFFSGAAGLAQYEDDCVADQAVRALRAKVVFEEDPEAPVESDRDAAPCRRNGAKRAYPARPRHARPADERCRTRHQSAGARCPRHPFC